MKKLIVFTCFAFTLMFNCKAFSQEFGIRAGMNLSNIMLKDNSSNYSKDFLVNPGYHVGIILNYPISQYSAIESGLILTTQGMRSYQSSPIMDDLENPKYQMTLYYLDIPFTVKQYYDIGGPKLYGLFGPYMSTGFYGITKATGTNSEGYQKIEREVNFIP